MLVSNVYIEPGFYMIARIASDARIAENCDLRSLQSLRQNSFYLKKTDARISRIAEVDIFLSQSQASQWLFKRSFHEDTRIARIASRNFQQSLRHLRSLRSYGNQALRNSLDIDVPRQNLKVSKRFSIIQVPKFGMKFHRISELVLQFTLSIKNLWIGCVLTA